MKYNVEYSKTAMNTIKKMDSSTSKLIRTWIEKNLIYKIENLLNYILEMRNQIKTLD